jgi:hypothetical protein
MKSSELKVLIREIVREEVKMELRKYLKEYKTKKVKESIVARKKPKKIVKRRYTKDATLNNILNETANSDDWETLGGETFSTNNMNDIIGKNYNMGGGQLSDDQMISSMGVDPNTVPDHVTDAITKDYSGIMKSINKKKGK